VVDIGCGTGLGGQALLGHRPLIIDGIDLSPEMLRQAAAKQYDGRPVYRQLLEADLTQRVPVADGTYAAAMSVGTFTHGHVGPEALGEVIRIIRSGGRAAIGINAGHFAAAGFGAALDQLVSDGRIADLQLVDRPIYADSDMNDPDKVAHVAVFTVT
jgi:SAM-dependent methyltransferase